ncbi:Amidohydrolase family [Zea mays]|uniref:Amidohydrolase family n=1 Tax=Zea mays TaxID=4577 RepID=A0A1D6N0U3_MAIZE|nr:Amidohydrolase family [Zea mays]
MGSLYGKMILRVCLFFPMPTWSRVSDLISEHGRSLSQWIHLGGVKAFLDGSLGSSSALFHEPYEGDPDNYGLQMTDLDSLLNRTLESDKSGLQVAIHAIGDKANDILLDMVDKIVDLNGAKDRRFRIEHAQHLAPGAANRFGKHGTIASVQPDHLLDDADHAWSKIGVERFQTSTPCKLSDPQCSASLLDGRSPGSLRSA